MPHDKGDFCETQDGNPPAGSSATTTAVTITGQYFTNAYAVASVQSWTFVSNTTITAVMPKGSAPGTVNVTVSNPSGTSNSVGFTHK